MKRNLYKKCKRGAFMPEEETKPEEEKPKEEEKPAEEKPAE